MRAQLLVVFTFLFSVAAMATHNRSGEILYKRVAPFGTLNTPIYTYSITVIKYTDDGPAVADRCVDTVYFGDGQKGVAPRINGGTTLGCSCSGSIQCGQLIVQQNNYVVKKNIYSILHTYAGAGSYLIFSSDPNRNPGIHNIPNSSAVPFYIESQLIITPGTAANSSPIFGSDPINQATLGICFVENLMTTDADGDSLSYELIPCAAPGYFYPETGGGSTSLDQSGTFSWCVPQVIAEYQVAYKVKEWRKNGSGVYQFNGSVIRDQQILVKAGTVELNELRPIDLFSVFPSPVSSQLIITNEGIISGRVKIELYDLQGKHLERDTEFSSTSQWIIPMQDLPSGLYLLKISDGKSVKSIKIIKE
ncbi:MAG: T9SS type A sorting domain-containing protein [Bacteroidia bacterium]|jgi:hypothetical protein|nr:T9SS type A sorting domain-containing protein [Bacteroidia bacterium]